jgi:hypothetical protein
MKPRKLTDARLVLLCAAAQREDGAVDGEAAKPTLFGGLVVSGWHTAAITMKLLDESGLPLSGGIIGSGGEISWS